MGGERDCGGCCSWGVLGGVEIIEGVVEGLGGEREKVAAEEGTMKLMNELEGFS